MWLINTHTLMMREFVDSRTPERYAILSHRWGPEETTFKDFQKRRRQDSDGYRKVVQFCNIAEQYGLEWAWADTCCIDKRSSSELSEAINSMYKYYSNADLCFVHVADVDFDGVDHDFRACHAVSIPRYADAAQEIMCDDCSTTMVEFWRSEWWTRGWTLQELLAPSSVILFSQTWNILGFKASPRETLQTKAQSVAPLSILDAEISDITKIPLPVLRDRDEVHRGSIAQRLSWAARRRTTRTEDSSYCLLGILDVNMPLLYGEGNRAWMRLQQEIIRSVDDESILAWTPMRYATLGYHDADLIPGWHPILATRIEDFKDSSQVRRAFGIDRPAYSIGHSGLELRIKASTAAILPQKDSRLIVIPLNCCLGNKPYSLVLKQLTCGHYVRVGPFGNRTVDEVKASLPTVEPQDCEDETLYVHVDNHSITSCSDPRGALLGDPIRNSMLGHFRQVFFSSDESTSSSELTLPDVPESEDEDVTAKSDVSGAVARQPAKVSSLKSKRMAKRFPIRTEPETAIISPQPKRPNHILSRKFEDREET